MKRRLQEYTPNSNSIDKLENIDQKYHLIVFSADGAETVSVRSGTCKDTRDRKEQHDSGQGHRHDNYRHGRRDGVGKLPTIIVFDKNWKEMGRFIETPRNTGQ